MEYVQDLTSLQKIIPLKSLVFLYLLVLSFTSAFSISWAISIPVLLCSSISFLYVFNIRNEYKFTKSDLYLFLFLLSICISFLINSPNFISNKPANHLFAYGFCVLVYYFVSKNIILKLSKKIKWEVLLKYLSIGVLISSIYCVVEFILSNFYEISLDKYIPRSEIQDYQPTIGTIVRARSFVEESGHYAFYLEAFGPLAIYYFKNIYKFNILGWFFIIAIVISFLLCFSVAGYLAVIIGFFVSGMTGKFSVSKIVLSIILLALIIFIVDYYMDMYIGQGIIQNVIDRFDGSSSGEERQGRALSAIQLMKSAGISNLLVGFGPAAYDTLRVDPVLSLYLLLFFEIGFLGLLFFLLFIISVFTEFKGASKIADSSNFKRYLDFSLIAILVHFFAIHNYFYPWLWVFLIFYQTGLKHQSVQILSEK